ncbi:NADPH-dependent glutamate synthase [uncultured Sphaerochaeta sp.]|uniref:NADPH-dependent glutamate synthase n=1 Tax=uncultured Sphaerochaeta sp. TaxID=886478 RepID=UPI002A0A9F9E|nr:NADPH-dependent glutamate synthase [uncultured Sphaerochaeta sp.]
MHVSIEALDAQAKEVLSKFENVALTPKDRGQIPMQEMPTQDPQVRITNMQEVALGYTDNQVRAEALRCLQCKNKPCIQGCPVAIDIPSFIAEAAKGEYGKAVEVIKQSSLLPSICGRVCPQESQCQKYCTVGKIHKDVEQSVSIGRIERFVADFARENETETIPSVAPDTNKKVAIVGSGPAGISAAADLRRAGHTVVMFEALHKAGGVLVYGIPEFRLPKKIVQHELDNLKQMGVEIRRNYLVGKTRKISDLMEKDGFDAVFVGSGAGLPKFMGIPGENYIGVFSANEYLTRSNLMKAYDVGESLTPLFDSQKVAVFGGGNVAMDAARTAKRLGAGEVSIVYRRTEVEMPARKEEVGHAKEEGIDFMFLHAPLEIVADDQGRVNGVKMITCELGEPDASGRRSPVEIPGSEKMYDFDTVIVAIGNTSNPLIKATTDGIEVNKRGNFIVNEETCETTLPGVYAGGDIVLGAATVILAMGQGRKAAKAMNEYLSTK